MYYVEMKPAACPKITKCPMFPIFVADTALAVIKALYCEGVYENCERYKSVNRGVIPPRNLLPDGRILSK
ncbi:MAG: hypothetical protein ACI9KE_001845 [Polyangiales bacterium]|jgi:hypothetical protein